MRVGIVDDQELVRTGIRTILETEPGTVVVGEAADGDGAVTLVGRELPGVLLLDVQRAGLDELGLRDRVRAAILAYEAGLLGRI